MNVDEDLERDLRERQKAYLEFLEDQNGQNVYASKVSDMVEENGVRLIISVNDIRSFDPDRTKEILGNGSFEMVALQRAVKEVVTNFNPAYGKQIDEFFVGFEGSFGKRHVSPRTLKSNFLGNMVCCEGIVTKCTSIYPKVVRSVHYCPATKKMLDRRYTDLTSYDAFPTSTAYPTQDDNNNPLETEYGLCSYKDHQTFSIQEMPENAPAGQLPRSVDIIVDNDLVDRCKPGDRVQVIGIYRCLPNKQAGFTSGTFRTVLIANNVRLLGKEIAPNFTNTETKILNKFRKKMGKGLIDVMARSLAPSIHGHEYVKKAILCMLLGGTEKILSNKTRLRGDINILLIGDPSVAKSQLLRYVLHTAPRAIPTTGRGSSGVGLTAAVTTDPETNERRLEAGAMVLADRGIVCIDEFDKMTEIDRTAIHEVMEQGRVTISKAGIQAKLNARCSVLAAANPVYGRYDESRTPVENISMQDSLLSRFDLIFILLDKNNEARDEAIAEHVLSIHRYRTPGEDEGAVLPMGPLTQTLSTEDWGEEAEDELRQESDIWEQNASYIPHSGNQKYLSTKFMRKYIHLAKTCRPTLTEEASNYISQKYIELRQSEQEKNEKERTTPVTARTLETMIRLATAHAKINLSKTVTSEDAIAAYELLHFACFKEAPRKQKRKRRAEGDGSESESEEGEDIEMEDLSKSSEAQTAKRPRKEKKTGEDIYDFDEDMESEVGSFAEMKKRGKDALKESQADGISVDRYATFQRFLRKVFDESGKEALELTSVSEQIQELAKENKFADGELKVAYERLQDENKVMISDNTIILI